MVHQILAGVIQVGMSNARGKAFKHPAFYDDAPRLTVRDPLAAFLGAAEDGVIEYGYSDVVKLAGHSCPTAAAAYLMTLRALDCLYAGALPVRGDIEIYFRERATNGVTGVMAAIVSFLTGAAQEGGFKGIGGRFDRRNLLFFDTPMEGQIGYRRRDSGAAVQASFDGSGVAASPADRALIERALAGSADEAEQARFRALWQERVRRLLIDRAGDPDVVVVRDWSGPTAANPCK